MKSMSRLCLSLILITLCFPLSEGASFVGERSIEGWGGFADPAGDCKVRAKKGKVIITVPGKEHNLNPTPQYDNVLGPRLLQPVAGDFQIQVKVLPFPRPQAGTATGKDKNSYVGAGLLVWQDEKTFLRCLRAALGERGDVYVHVEAFQKGKRLIGRYFVTIKTRVIPDQAVYLRVQRQGKQLTAWHSLDGKQWTLNARFDFTLPEKLQAGVAAVNAINKEFAPEYEELKLSK
jgi:regulation of enolase protein 1 (concanavalin A-like superfamily)